MRDGRGPDPTPVPTIQADVVRDKRGDWVPISRTFSRPTSDATRFGDRWLMGVYEAAKETFPVLASVLAEDVDGKLVPAVERARTVEAEENNVLAERRRSASAANEAVEEEIRAAKASHEAERAALAEAEATAKRAASEAYLAAADAIGKAGRAFVPEDTHLGLAPPVPPTVGYLAGREGIASPELDRRPSIPAWIEVPLTAVLGAFIGVSVFNATGFVHLANVARDRPLNLALAGTLGVASVAFGGRAAKLAGAWASQAAGLGRKSALAFAGAAAMTAALAAIHGVADFQGIAQSAGLRASMAGRAGPSPFAMAVMSLTFGLPYLAHSFLASLKAGRADATEPRVEYLRQRELDERLKEWRTAETLSALSAVGTYRALAAEAERLSAACRQMAASHAAAVEAVERRKVEVPSEMSGAAKDRIDRTRGDAEACQAEVERALGHVACVMGESGFLWPWLRRLRPGGPRRRVWGFLSRDRSGRRAF